MKSLVRVIFEVTDIGDSPTDTCPDGFLSDKVSGIKTIQLLRSSTSNNFF